jgi:hypothetical protein
VSSLLSSVSGLVVTFFVPAVVWTTLGAGLFQLVREEIRHFQVAPRRARRLERYGHRAG